MATSSSPGVGDTRHLVILGIRGVPAAHGGFETFAARLAPWMRDHGWRVTVYCQGSETGAIHEDEWEGVRRIHIPVGRDGAAGTIEFDVKSARHALAEPGLILMLGYNTGFLATWLRILLAWSFTWARRALSPSLTASRSPLVTPSISVASAFEMSRTG